ncbi:MAG: SpoIIE family protein phosphatase [Verrucomicrobia bacterium]|jgi:protein phosphatase|nr:SpoIIE family protein phosphatase [Verrucomicrobiota bacterium]
MEEVSEAPRREPEVAARSETGPVRRENEDSCLVADLEEGEWIFAVADGVGGHARGKEASSTTLRLLEERLRASAPDLSMEEAQNLLREALVDINDCILNKNTGKSGRDRMGTTLTAVWRRAGGLHVAQIGDSRLYCFSHDKLRRLTVDQTEAGERFAVGKISEEEERRYPGRNVIRQAVGIPGEKFQPVLQLEELIPGASYLLCSDGLTGGLRDREIEDALRNEEGKDLASLAEGLLQQSLRNFGKDNTTLVLFRF